MIHIYRTTNNDTETLAFDYAFLPYEIHIQGLGTRTPTADFVRKKTSGVVQNILNFKLPTTINYDYLVGFCSSALLIAPQDQKYVINDVQQGQTQGTNQ